MLIRRVRRVIGARAAMIHPDLQAAAYLMLAYVAEEGPQRSSAIAERFDIDKGAISRQVQHLVELGLLERKPDPADGRASILKVTAQGPQAATTRSTRSVAPGSTSGSAAGTTATCSSSPTCWAATTSRSSPVSSSAQRSQTAVSAGSFPSGSSPDAANTSPGGQRRRRRTAVDHHRDRPAAERQHVVVVAERSRPRRRRCRRRYAGRPAPRGRTPGSSRVARSAPRP